MSGWKRQQLDRSITDRERSKVIIGLLLALAAAALIVTSPTRSSSPVRPTRPAGASTDTTRPGSKATSRWTPAQTTYATVYTRRFMEGYLPYLYGQAPASQVKDATAGLIRTLQHERRVVPQGIRSLHPHIVAIHVSPPTAGNTIATVLVSDSAVINYPIQLTLTEIKQRWLVSGLEQAR